MLNFHTLSSCPLPQTLRFLLEPWKYPSNIWFGEISVIFLNNWTQVYSSVAQTGGKRCFTWSPDYSCREMVESGSQLRTLLWAEFYIGEGKDLWNTLMLNLKESEDLFSFLELHSLSISNTNKKLSSVWFLFDLILPQSLLFLNDCQTTRVHNLHLQTDLEKLSWSAPSVTFAIVPPWGQTSHVQLLHQKVLRINELISVTIWLFSTYICTKFWAFKGQRLLC